MPQIVPNPPHPADGIPTNPAATQLWHAPAPLRLWHLTSLDAPTVAIVWSLALAWAAHVRLPGWAPLLLALVAWAIYMSDRLLDARAGFMTPPLHQLRERHHFHWKHRWVLGALGSIATAAALWMVSALLPAGARAPDSVVAAATLAYFSGVHARRPLPGLLTRFIAPFLTREFLVAILFTAGCCLPAWSQVGSTPHVGLTRAIFVAAACLALTAWLNCYAIGRWESPASHACKATPVKVFRIALLSALVCVLFAVLLSATAPRCGALCAAAAVSASLLALLDRLAHKFTPITLRAGADLVLLTPAVLLPLGIMIR